MVWVCTGSATIAREAAAHQRPRDRDWLAGRDIEHSCGRELEQTARVRAFTEIHPHRLPADEVRRRPEGLDDERSGHVVHVDIAGQYRGRMLEGNRHFRDAG